MAPIDQSEIPSARELFPRRHGKAALAVTFHNPETSRDEDYILFELSPRPIAVVIALTADRKIVAVRQHRLAANQTMIELPGGLADGDEPPEETARRELREETGFAAGSVVRLTERPVWFDPASVKTPFWPCLALDCRPIDGWQPNTSEPNEVLTLPLAEWVERIYRGEILDAKTIVTTFLALPHLER